MDQANSVTEEKAELGLTTASLAGLGARPAARAVPASSSGVAGASSARAAIAPAIAKQPAPLFSAEEAKDFRTRWDAIQVGFVDEPRKVVEQADSLVAQTMMRLAEMFATERAKLDGQ